VFIPARRYVTSAKSSGAGYRDGVRVGPNNRLHIGVDVADKATVVHVQPRGSYTDNVTSRGDLDAGKSAQGGVVAAGAAAIERVSTDGCVAVAFGIANERECTVRRVGVAGSFAIQRLKPIGRVEETAGVAKEGLSSSGRVVGTGGVV
jgi:hypothetical protein